MFFLLFMSLCCLAEFQSIDTQNVNQGYIENEIDFDKEDHEQGDIYRSFLFPVADLLAWYKFGDMNVLLEAYKIRSKSDQWVSIGYPIFVHNSQGLIYDFTPEFITARVQLLSDDQRLNLEEAAKVHDPNIQKAFVYQMPLQHITCLTRFIYDGREYQIHGKIDSFDQVDTVLEIEYNVNSEIRNAFQKRVKLNYPLRWKCLAIGHSNGEIESDYIVIPGAMVQDVADLGSMFQATPFTYITKKQLSKLATNVRLRFNAERNYNLDRSYDEIICHKLMQSAKIIFQQHPINDAIGNLSHYGSNDQLILSPKQCYEQLSGNFIAFNYTFITFSNDDNCSADQAYNNENDEEYFAISVWPSYEVIFRNQEIWQSGIFSLEEQLRQLNLASQNSIQWNFLSTQLIPTSLKMGSVSRSSLKNDLMIQIDHRYPKHRQFRKKIVIADTMNSKPTPDIVNDIYKKLNEIGKDSMNESELWQRQKDAEQFQSK
uniref:Uncharacterized protein n=1 Tax=Romanomermis culicivorax TaxID=13658 RepID=A0A915IBX6_ROMCU